MGKPATHLSATQRRPAAALPVWAPWHTSIRKRSATSRLRRCRQAGSTEDTPQGSGVGLALNNKTGERLVVRAGIVNGESCDLAGLRDCDVHLFDWSSQVRRLPTFGAQLASPFRSTTRASRSHPPPTRRPEPATGHGRRLPQLHGAARTGRRLGDAAGLHEGGGVGRVPAVPHPRLPRLHGAPLHPRAHRRVQQRNALRTVERGLRRVRPTTTKAHNKSERFTQVE